MSASSNEFKTAAGDVVIYENDLTELIAKLKTINDKYKAKGFWSTKSHGDTLENILIEAEAGLKSVKATREMTITDQSAEKKSEILADIRKTYMEILKELETKFDKGRIDWENDNKKILEGMPLATRYDMYNCLHLNADTGHHSSSRNIGLLLQSMYVKLGNREKIQSMKNLKSTDKSIASTPAPETAPPELRSMNKQDLNFLVGRIRELAANYQAEGGTEHAEHVKSIVRFAEEKLSALGREEIMISANVKSETVKSDMLKPKIKAAYIEIAENLQAQFNNGFNTWAAKNKSLIRSGINVATQYNLYNCLHLNAEPNKHKSSRNIGVLLQDIYARLGDRENMARMQSLQPSAQKSSAPTLRSGSS